ncbi:type II secretion system protein M [Aliidiomarina halalkaliphila]|uniref:Type II secretion system protein M n=1 Tax=Aliidiomarina halalkaliphila TaxID=2593535 RepID=A0A552X5K1_9GAMM|nr:type II secretion system protein M [Aliidiomarina halalkaliphila]TRW50307.1 type II secretion system protein M [Aliidiomarina halalkaliphila]
MKAVTNAFAPVWAKIQPFTTKYQAQLQQRWQRLQVREQRMLQVLAAFLAIFILWFFIWMPLQTRVAVAEQRLQSQQTMFQRVATGAAQIEAARATDQRQQTSLSANQLSGFINTQASELDIEISRVQPQQDSLILTFNEVEFDALVILIARLVERGVIIENLDASETNDVGIVRVRRLQVRAQ